MGSEDRDGDQNKIGLVKIIIQEDRDAFTSTRNRQELGRRFRLSFQR
jgi:hypothetical protein